MVRPLEPCSVWTWGGFRALSPGASAAFRCTDALATHIVPVRAYVLATHPCLYGHGARNNRY